MIKELTKQEALQAVVDGKQVIMIWNMVDNGALRASNLTETIFNSTAIGKTFIQIELDSCEPEEPTEVEFVEEDEVPETVVTDPDTTPVTVKIPNSKKAEKEKWRKLDDEQIIKLRKDGLSEMKIALELDTTQPTVHSHIQKLKKEGRL